MRDPNTFVGLDDGPTSQVSLGWLRAFVGFWLRKTPDLVGQLPAVAGVSRWMVQRQSSCDVPVRTLYVAWDYAMDRQLPVSAVVLRRCRRCQGCGRMKSADWARRARLEYEAASRTWMGTLTVAPDQHALMDAQIAAAGLWPDRSRLSEGGFAKTLFRLRAGYLGQRVTRWIDLQRAILDYRGAQSGELRYLLVAEAHESGLPHMHILLHEAQGMRAI